MSLEVGESRNVPQDDGSFPCIERTIARLRTHFIERYVELHTGGPNALDQIERDLYLETRKSLRKRARVATADSFGMSLADLQVKAQDDNMSENPSVDWLAWHHEFRQKIELGCDPELYAQYDVVIREDGDYRDRFKATSLAIELATTEATSMLKEIEDNQYDPDFIAACDVWANSPDSLGYRGEEEDVGDRIGYNSAIIHFIEYRASRKKHRRFQNIRHPATAQGLIDFTNEVKTPLYAVHNWLESGDAQPVEIPANVVRVNVIDDEDAGELGQRNRRIYILLDDGNVIIAFQKQADNKPRITSVINTPDLKYYTDIVDNSLKGKDRGQINRLSERTLSVLAFARE